MMCCCGSITRPAHDNSSGRFYFTNEVNPLGGARARVAGDGDERLTNDRLLRQDRSFAVELGAGQGGENGFEARPGPEPDLPLEPFGELEIDGRARGAGRLVGRCAASDPARREMEALKVAHCRPKDADRRLP